MIILWERVDGVLFASRAKQDEAKVSGAARSQSASPVDVEGVKKPLGVGGGEDRFHGKDWELEREGIEEEMCCIWQMSRRRDP